MITRFGTDCIHAFILTSNTYFTDDYVKDMFTKDLNTVMNYNSSIHVKFPKGKDDEMFIVMIKAIFHTKKIFNAVTCLPNLIKLINGFNIVFKREASIPKVIELLYKDNDNGDLMLSGLNGLTTKSFLTKPKHFNQVKKLLKERFEEFSPEVNEYFYGNLFYDVILNMDIIDGNVVYNENSKAILTQNEYYLFLCEFINNHVKDRDYSDDSYDHYLVALSSYNKIKSLCVETNFH